MEKELTEMEVAATCAIQHIDIFLKQDHERSIADMGEPCITCPINEYCCKHGFKWFSHLKPILKDSKAELHLCFKPDIQE